MNMNNLYQLKAMLWTVFSIFSLYDVTRIVNCNNVISGKERNFSELMN